MSLFKVLRALNTMIFLLAIAILRASAQQLEVDSMNSSMTGMTGGASNDERFLEDYIPDEVLEDSASDASVDVCVTCYAPAWYIIVLVVILSFLTALVVYYKCPRTNRAKKVKVHAQSSVPKSSPPLSF